MSTTDVQEIKDTLKDIVYLLKGNPIDKTDGGLLEQVKTNTRKTNELYEDKRRRKWLYGVAGVVFTGVQIIINLYFK